MPTELKGEALLDYYREAVRVCFDDELADATILICNRGWYNIFSARRCPDGSVGANTELHATGYRAVKVREMADELLQRAKEE